MRGSFPRPLCLCLGRCAQQAAATSPKRGEGRLVPTAEPVPDFTVLHAALAPYVHDSVEAKMRPEDIIRAQEFSKQCIESSYAQALFGWQSGAQSQRYTRTANKRTLAQRAAQRLSGKP